MMLMVTPPDRGGLTKGVERPPLLMDHQVKQRQLDEIHTIDSFLPFLTTNILWSVCKMDEHPNIHNRSAGQPSLVQLHIPLSPSSPHPAP